MEIQLNQEIRALMDGQARATSLLAMELRNRLEASLARPLSATLAYNYPTIDALVGFLCAEPSAVAPQPQSARVVAPIGHDDIADMSDDEAATLLRRAR